MDGKCIELTKTIITFDAVTGKNTNRIKFKTLSMYNRLKKKVSSSIESGTLSPVAYANGRHQHLPLPIVVHFQLASCWAACRPPPVLMWWYPTSHRPKNNQLSEGYRNCTSAVGLPTICALQYIRIGIWGKKGIDASSHRGGGAVCGEKSI